MKRRIDWVQVITYTMAAVSIGILATAGGCW